MMIVNSECAGSNYSFDTTSNLHLLYHGRRKNTTPLQEKLWTNMLQYWTNQRMFAKRQEKKPGQCPAG
jgi:hypothetical protein